MATCQIPFQAKQPLCYVIPAESFIWSVPSFWLIQPQTEVALWEITSYVYLLYRIITSGLISSAKHIRKEKNLISGSQESLNPETYLTFLGYRDAEKSSHWLVCQETGSLITFVALWPCDFGHIILLLWFSFHICKTHDKSPKTLTFRALFSLWTSAEYTLIMYSHIHSSKSLKKRFLFRKYENKNLFFHI